MAVLHIGNEESFESKVIKSERPVLVDFFATWCGPCKMVAPELDAVDEALGDKAVIVKVNIDEFPKLTERYGVRSVPTFVLFKGGNEVKRFSGYRTRKDLMAALETE